MKIDKLRRRFWSATCTLLVGSTLAVSGVAIAANQSPAPAPASAPAAKPTLSAEEAKFDEMMRRWIDRNPDVVVDALNRYVLKQRENETKLKDQLVLDTDKDLVTGGRVGDMPIPSIGADQGINLVYFLDVDCIHCERMSSVLGELIKRNPDLHIVQRYVRFLQPQSDYGARVAMMVAQRYAAKYADFYHALMTWDRLPTVDSMDQVIVKVLGADALPLIKSELGMKTESEQLSQMIDFNMNIAKRVNVEGTPFFYVSGAGEEGIFRGEVPVEKLQAAVDKARGKSLAN